MREIKFSYIQKGSGGGYQETIYTLDQLECGKVERIILAQKEIYGIIARRQCTNLKDKNGTEIYQDDLLRIKSKMGDKGEHTTDAIYQVTKNRMGSLLLKYRCLAWVDGAKNQVPIDMRLCEEYGSLTTSREPNYDRLAVPDTYSEDRMMRQKWQNNHYTEDVEIFGNIYENPELLEQSK